MGKAAAKIRSLFVCQQCGHSERKWMGRCAQCGEWSSMVEEQTAGKSGGTADKKLKAVSLPKVRETHRDDRLFSGNGELDRVLGGGLVPGSMALLGGEPGIGKSTLLGQMLAGFAERSDRPLLYVSGEESIAQTAMRARRIGAAHPKVEVVAETHLESIIALARRMKPAVIAVDSIQTVHSAALESIPGSVGQVRECAARILAFAKETGIPAVVVGHVTKDGHIAGPKTLEHVVDVVLHFEGEGGSPYRVLRAFKNRFGSTQEIGVFEMRGGGLVEVENPSELFLAERPVGSPGSVVVASAEGTRPILVEVQALVAPASAGVGRRTAAGVDGNRLALLLAVLSQRASLDVIANDVFVNVAGGVKLNEPAIDLGVVAAVASSFRERPIDARTAVFGEVGLAGEVRGVGLAEVRLAELAKLGFNRVILPKQNCDLETAPKGIELVGVGTVYDALTALIPR
ncbi:MAG: DNA repair protein RadA [Deltaproteobacteria bacterium]|jgi:DNA repair protein RadA/Sms|nr:DNA repair protein RadA [Deltaproteobacteria bacterium]